MNSGAAGAGVTGLGAGFGPGRGPEAAGAGEGVLLAGAAGVTGAGAAGAAGAGLGAGAPGLGAAGRAAAAGDGAAGEGAALRGAPGLAAVLPALPPGPCKASVNLRTTGASIVEDAERTNSPSSWSLAMTTLLSTPNSLASSYTRTLATSLLCEVRLPPDRRYFMGVLIAYSSSAHRNLDLLPTREVPDRTVIRAVLLLHCGADRSTCRRSSVVSSGPWTLKARGNARRRTAWSRQTTAGCRYAPRPGSVPR